MQSKRMLAVIRGPPSLRPWKGGGQLAEEPALENWKCESQQRRSRRDNWSQLVTCSNHATSVHVTSEFTRHLEKAQGMQPFHLLAG